MSTQAVALIAALIGAVAGVGGGLGAQVVQARAQRKLRVGTLGAQLAAASYIVVYTAKVSATKQHEVVDMPRFQEGLLAASELAIIAPAEVAEKATSLANSMTSAATEATNAQTDAEWSDLLDGVRKERLDFIASMRASKLRLVVEASLTAATITAVGGR